VSKIGYRAAGARQPRAGTKFAGRSRGLLILASLRRFGTLFFWLTPGRQIIIRSTSSRLTSLPQDGGRRLNPGRRTCGAAPVPGDGRGQQGSSPPFSLTLTGRAGQSPGIDFDFDTPTVILNVQSLEENPVVVKRILANDDPKCVNTDQPQSVTQPIKLGQALKFLLGVPSFGPVCDPVKVVITTDRGEVAFHFD
jgi:hypothetical protein